MTLDPWDGGMVLVKTILYAATFGAAGGVFFLGYCGRQLPVLDYRRIQRLTGAFILSGIAVSGARILLLAGSMSGDASGMIDPSLTRMIVQGPEGAAAGIRMAGLGLAAFALSKDRRFFAVAIIGASLAATSFAWVGHARAAALRAPATVLVGVHLLSAAFWLGALMPLHILARDPQSTAIAAAAARFGRMAVIVVGLLLTAGIILLWILLDTPSQLWMSGYGRLVMIKMGLVAVLLSLAALNKWRLTPRLRDRDARAVRWLRRSITAELLLAGLILAVTAAFTTLMGPPAPQ
jgi:putative copper export protein